MSAPTTYEAKAYMDAMSKAKMEGHKIARRSQDAALERSAYAMVGQGNRKARRAYAAKMRNRHDAKFTNGDDQE